MKRRVAIALVAAGLVACHRKAAPMESTAITITPAAPNSATAAATATAPSSSAAPVDPVVAVADLEALLGDRARAQAVFGQAMSMAEFYGVNRRTMMVLTKAMLRAGIDVDDVPQVTAGLVDVGTASSWPEAHGVLGVYKHAHDRGWANTQDVESLAELLPKTIFLDGIADARGTPGIGAERRAAVENDLHLAHVKPREFMTGALLAILKKYGHKKLGDAAVAAKP